MANKVSNVNTLQVDGHLMTPDSTEVTVDFRDTDGSITRAHGADVPSAEAGYAVGCQFIDIDASGVANISLVNEGDATSCSFVTGTAATTFQALTDTAFIPATAATGSIPWLNGSNILEDDKFVVGTPTATSGNVLYADGTDWDSATPDTAGLVAKSGDQTGIAGAKTWTGAQTFSSTATFDGAVTCDSTLTLTGLTLTGDINMEAGDFIYLRGAGATEFLYSSGVGAVNLEGAGTMTFDGLTIAIGNSATSGTTIGTTSDAAPLTLNFGTGDCLIQGNVAGAIKIGANAQTGDMRFGESSATNAVYLATGNGNKTLYMVTGTGTNAVNICTSTGTDTISIGTGGAAKVITIGSVTLASSLSLKMGTGNFSLAGVAASTITIGKADQTGTITVGNSTGILQIDIGVGGTAVKTINIGNEATQPHVIDIGGAVSLPVIDGATITLGDTATVRTINIGAINAVQTIHIGDNDTPANQITMGGTNSLPTITGTTVTVTAGTLFDVNGHMDVSGNLSCVDIEATEMIEADLLNQAKMYWCDDFAEAGAVLGSTVYSKCHWTGGGTNGTQTVTASPGGTIVLATTATGNRTSTLTYSGACTFDNDLAWIWEARIKTTNITNTKIDLGMYLDANDEILFRFDTGSGEADAANGIYLVTENDNAGEVLTDTTINLTANTYFTFRIEVAADDSFEVYINGSEVLASHPSNTIRDVLFVPYFYVDNKAAAEAKNLSIDYCKIWQDRAAT